MLLPSQEHKKLIVHILTRTAELYKNLKNREDRRGDRRYNILASLLKEFTANNQPEVLEFRLKRAEYRLLQEQLEGVRKVLVESTIPTYMQRIDALKDTEKNKLTEDEVAKHTKMYEDYIGKNKARAALCEDVLRLLDRQL